MNLTKFLTTFLLLTTLLSKTIHYHYYMNSSPSSKKSHKYRYDNFSLKTSTGQILKSNKDLLLIPVSQSNNTDFIFQKTDNKDYRTQITGLVIYSPGKGVLSHTNGKVTLNWLGYNGLGELWHEEKTDQGIYYRGEGGESGMYLSYKDGKLSMSHSKGSTELWK